MTHEIGHMFGIKHCQWLNCVMQGSNHLEESDRRPLDFCPICLRKTQSAVGFKIAKRYKVQETLCTITHLKRRVKWLISKVCFLPFHTKSVDNFNSNQKLKKCRKIGFVSSTGLVAVDGGGSNFHPKSLSLSV